MGVKLGNKNINSVIKEVIPKTYKLFDGHVDVEGLKQIGWDDEDIKFAQDTCIKWYSDEDEVYKLTEDELNNDFSSNTRFLRKDTKTSIFNGTNKLIAIPKLDTSKRTSTSSMFQSCKYLIAIPLLDTSNVTDMFCMFNKAKLLETIPLLDTSKVTNMEQMFSGCSNLRSIPKLDTSKVTNMSSMFDSCSNLRSIPQLNTSNVVKMRSMFARCALLTTIPQLDTSKVTDMAYMFYYSNDLFSSLPLLDTSSVTDMSDMFYSCNNLTTLGGFKDLGKAYDTTKSANYSYYTLNLYYARNLTHESLMNVINNLYDIASKGCQLQQLRLGSTNLEKLTAEEIAIATNKGWTVS